MERRGCHGRLASMRAVDDILRRAKRLKRGELSRLVKQLDAHLSATANGAQAERKGPHDRTRALSRDARSGNRKKRPKVSYARSLALAGTAHSDYVDVSSHKGKHLAEVYAPRREG